MSSGTLGRVYEHGDIIIRQGETADRLFVIQEGTVDILVEKDGGEVLLRKAGAGELIGEMSIFEKDLRSATVRAAGRVRALTVDKGNFLKRIHEDPTIAYKVVETLSHRVRELSNRLAAVEGSEGRPE